MKDVSIYVALTLEQIQEIRTKLGDDNPLSQHLAEQEHDQISLTGYVIAAQLKSRDGELEIDSNALVSKGDDEGAYVMAWLWVADGDLKALTT